MRNLAVIHIVLTLHKSAVYANLKRNLETSISRVEGPGGHVEEAKAVLAESHAGQRKFVEVTWRLLGVQDCSQATIPEECKLTTLLKKTYHA